MLRPVLALFASLALCSSAPAQQDPGSLLVYPMFDDTPGQFTIFSVTNTALAFEQQNTIRAEFVFVAENCQTVFFSEILTPGDNFTGFTRALTSFNNRRGFFYVHVTDTGDFGNSISFNHLIGTTVHIDGLRSEIYELPVHSYRSPLEEFSLTDLDANGRRDLNGAEYETSPEFVMIPMFLGQSQSQSVPGSEQILANLNGLPGTFTSVDFLVWNDNEELFSVQYQLEDCWDRVRLIDLSFVFTNNFLRNNTNDDPAEFFGFPFVEAGWYRFRGGVLFGENNELIENPVVLGPLVRRNGDWSIFAFGEGENPNAILLD